MKAQKLTREEAESNLEFLGFIIFENKLKPSTSRVIMELSQAGIRNIMCTGDNILTAISVAKECTMIDSDETCFIPHLIEGTLTRDDSRGNTDQSCIVPGLITKTSLIWESVDDPDVRLDSRTLLVSSRASLMV